MLKEISIRVYKSEPRPNFYFYSGCVENLYFRNLGEIQLNSFQIINLYFTDQHFGIVKNYGAILDVNVQFNFAKFEKLKNNFDKKLEVLSAIHKAFLNLSAIFNWDTEKFENSYIKCIDEKLQYNWYYKGKLFRSPNHKFYFGLWHHVEIGEYEIWEVLFDKHKNEITRRLCFKDDVNTFFVSYASWENQNDYFFYSFNGPKKKFTAKIDDILNNITINLMKNSSEFFKFDS